MAYDLSGLSEILRAQGDLAAAQEKQQAALAIRNQLAEKKNAANSRLLLAIIALEDHKPSLAEAEAAETAKAFQEEKSVVEEAAAREVEARSLLALGKIPEAEIAIKRARALAAHSSPLTLGFDQTITSARLAMSKKSPPISSTLASIKNDLESSLSHAHKCGYLEYEYKLALAIGEVELRTGEIRSGRARLEALARDANEKGFYLIGRSAAVLASD